MTETRSCPTTSPEPAVTSNPAVGQDPLQWAGWLGILMIVAAMSVVTAKLIDSPPLGSANDRSRWCTVWSLVERGTYQIDEIRKVPGWDTIDLVKHEGHFYSTKPPLFTTLLAGLYWGIHWATGLNLLNDTATVARIMLLLVNILPFLFLVLLLARVDSLRLCRAHPAAGDRAGGTGNPADAVSDRT